MPSSLMAPMVAPLWSINFIGKSASIISAIEAYRTGLTGEALASLDRACASLEKLVECHTEDSLIRVSASAYRGANDSVVLSMVLLPSNAVHV